VAGTVPNLPPEAQRYLQALEVRLEQAERSLRLLPQQRGPLPGWLRAGTVEASSIIASTITAALLQGPQPPSGPFASLDLTGSTPGQSPLLRISDGTRDRIQIGNLASYTDPAGVVSPAMYGGRAVDATGLLVWDTVGHSQVMKVLATSNTGGSFAASTLVGVAGPPFGITGTGGEVQITSAGFSLSRMTTVKIEGLASAAGWTTSGIIPLIAPIYIRVDGQANSVPGTVFHSLTVGSTTAPTSCTPYQLLTLPAGSYTARLWWNSPSANERLDVYGYNLTVFQLGS
jgi:hypothetical protein